MRFEDHYILSARRKDTKYVVYQVQSSAFHAFSPELSVLCCDLLIPCPYQSSATLACLLSLIRTGVSTSNEASSQSLIAFSRNSPSLELIGNRPQCRLEARGLVGSTNPQCLDVIASFDDDLHIQYMGYAALDTLDPKRHSRQLKLN